MDKQKINKKKFPLLEAMLITPKEGEKGVIGICTNTSAPGEVINEISNTNRRHVCVLGSLIVSRDGVERMIINSLAHNSLKYLILFSEESLTFAPCTNLLQAIMNGFDNKKNGNFINGGVAASPHYPNLNDNILAQFRNEIVVIPIFMHANKNSREIIRKYIDWVRPKISTEIISLIEKIIQKDKIYYDSLNKIIEEIGKLPINPKNEIKLDPKDFQQLQPPTINLDPSNNELSSKFLVSIEDEQIRLDVQIKDKWFYLKSKNDFLLAYSLMKHLGDDKKYISPLEQLLIGAELGRVSLELTDKKLAVKPFNSYSPSDSIKKSELIELEPKVQLKIDSKFYYRISSKEKRTHVLCMAFDICAEFYELVSDSVISLIEKIGKENRFDDYEMDILHRMDIGAQIARASIATKFGYSFVQDLSVVFKTNKTRLPFVIADGDSFLDVHKTVLRKIYTDGITEEHGDKWKGLARTASVLAIYRRYDKSLLKLPEIYRQGSEDTETLRKLYKKELLRKDHDGTYTYGERTRKYFGYDQLDKTVRLLKNNPNFASIVQRFDPSKDMSSYKDKDTGKLKFTHDPCLTHDIFFIHKNKLHSFHIARAHNIVNAYPENIFGLHDAYTEHIREKLGLKAGDMYVLSNRANILLITEEQRTKKILSEPSKPVGEIDTMSGPYLLGKDIKGPDVDGFVSYINQKAKETLERPKNNNTLKKLEDYCGQNIIKKSIKYLKDKGVMHNNPILSEYYAGSDNPQQCQLAFFQANVFGGKIHGTAVFTNKKISDKENDIKLCNYILTKYKEGLDFPLGDLTIVYVGFKI